MPKQQDIIDTKKPLFGIEDFSEEDIYRDISGEDINKEFASLYDSGESVDSKPTPSLPSSQREEQSLLDYTDRSSTEVIHSEREKAQKEAAELEEKRLLEKQARYFRDPVLWANDILGFEPDVWQRQAMEYLVKYRFLAISTGTGTGKTALDAVIVLWFMSTRPFPKVPCTAPSQAQLYGALWAEIGKWRRQSQLLVDMFKWTKTQIYHRKYQEDWFAVARTSRLQAGKETVESLQGLHAEHILMLCDEASGIPDQVFNAVDGAITTPGAFVLLTSNPTRRSGYFYRTITDKRLQVEGGGSFKVMFVNAEDAKYCDPIHIKRTLERYGRDSNFYKVKVLGKPPDTEESQLITPEQIYAAHERGQLRKETEVEPISTVEELPEKLRKKIDISSEKAVETAIKLYNVLQSSLKSRENGENSEDNKDNRKPTNEKDGVVQITDQIIISCDPARYGPDSSVFYVRVGQNVVERKALQGMSTTKVAEAGHSLIKKYDPHHFCVDAIGIGSGVADRLHEFVQDFNLKPENKAKGLKYRVKVHEVDIGAKPLPEKRKSVTTGIIKDYSEDYYNLKAQLGWSMRMHMDMISICIDTDLLDEELPAVRYGWDDKEKKIKIQPKRILKRFLRRSPDDNDAFWLLFYPDLLLRSQIKVVYKKSTFAIGSRQIEIDTGTRKRDQARSNANVNSTSKFLAEEKPTMPGPVVGKLASSSLFSFGKGRVGSRRYSRFSDSRFA